MVSDAKFLQYGIYFNRRQSPTINYLHKLYKEPEICQEEQQDKGSMK
jgi:hypothetical protein